MFLYNSCLVSISASVCKREKVKKSQGTIDCPKELETEQWNSFNYAKFCKEFIGALRVLPQKNLTSFESQYVIQYNTQRTKDFDNY